MYIPAFLPCPKCNTGPFVGRVKKGYLHGGHLRGDCHCGYVSTGSLLDQYDLQDVAYTDKELQSLNIQWNETVREMTRIYGVDNA